MIDPELIAEINALAQKNKTVGLTDEEKERRQKLREEYIFQFRNGFRSYLDNIDVVDENGDIVDLKKRKKSLN